MKYFSMLSGLKYYTAVIILLLVISCNKGVQPIGDIVAPTTSGDNLGQTLAANPDDSLFYAMVRRAGLISTLENGSADYTVFVANNNAMRIFINAASGGLIPVAAPDAVHSGFIATSLPEATANAIVSYNIVPQRVLAADIPATFPNLQYPSIFNPAPTISALLRLTTFLSTSNGAWFNNIPLIGFDQVVSNGVIHHSAFLNTPPQRFLWDRIDTDPALTYLRAAILRADSTSVTPTAPGVLQGALLNIGANLTVFAPSDVVFQGTLTAAITQALINLGVPPATAAAQAAALASTPDVFNNPALFPVLTAQTVQGIVVYHVLGRRAFTNNFPTDTLYVPTLLNGAIATHPGVGLRAAFGAPFVTGATVKGLYNGTPANIILNASPLLPDPVGTSDQHFLNGTLHVIDQVLLPLPL